MHQWITDTLEQYGYIGILFMMALENLFPPIPSEAILPFGGFMTSYTKLTVAGVIAMASVGSVVGAVILYGIGRLLDADRLERIVERWGRWLRLNAADVRKAEAWFRRYGYRAVLIGRMIPLVRSLISIPAGMAHMNFPLFLLYTTIGTLIWNTALITAGAALGESWEDITRLMDTYSTVAYVVLAAGLALLLFLIVRRKRRSS